MKNALTYQNVLRAGYAYFFALAGAIVFAPDVIAPYYDLPGLSRSGLFGGRDADGSVAF